MRDELTQKIFSNNLIVSLIEITCCLLFIVGFVSFVMNSYFFHGFSDVIEHIGLYLVMVALSIAVIVAYLTWNDDKKILKWFRFDDILPEREVLLLLLTLAVCVFTIPIVTTWSLGEFDQNNVGGIFPIFDAGAYYNGAEHVLDTGKIDLWNERRPITSVFLATRLLVTNFDYRSTLLIQGMLEGISAFIAGMAVAKTFGKCAGFLMFAVLFAFSAVYLPDSISENIGFIFGCLSFSLVWYGIFKRNGISFLIGVFFFTIGFVTRPGPFLFLLGLIICAGFFFNDKKGFNWKNSFLTTLVIGLGIFLNQCILWLFGEEKNIMMGNFATTLYGLAAGGKGWQQYIVDFPYEAAHYPEGELFAFLYTKSFELITANPVQFIKTIFGLYLTIPLNLFNQLFQVGTHYKSISSTSNYEYILFSIVLIFIVIGIFRFFLYSQAKFIKIVFLIFLVTTFISLPFYFMDGGIRCLIIVLPYFGAGIVIGGIGWRSAPDISKETVFKNTQSLFTFTIPVVFGILILTSAFLTPVGGPLIKHSTLNISLPRSEPVCLQNETLFTMRVDAGIPYLEMIKNNTEIPVFSPVVNPGVLSSPTERYILSYYYNLTDFMNGNDFPILFYGYDLHYRSSYIILAPKSAIVPEHRIIQFCGELENTTHAEYRMNESALTEFI